MSNSIGEQILEAIAVKLAAIPGATTFRSRAAAVALPEGIAIIIKPKEELVAYLANPVAKREFMVEIEIIARGDVPEQVADPVRVAMHAALMADPTLGGLSLRIVEQDTIWTVEEADQTAMSAISRYKIIFLTPTATLAAVA